MEKVFKYIIFIFISIFPFLGIQGQVCIANFDYTIETDISSLTYQFYDKSTAQTGVINKYEWDFGDGGNSAKQNPEHQFLSEGTFTIRLTIYTSDSCISSYTDTIHVEKVVPPGCMAYFTFIHLTQSTNYTYAFADHSMAGSGDTLNSWYWNFDDGTVSSNSNPIHQFQATGNYTVSLSITTKGGCSSSYSFTISVYNGSSPCQASYTSTQDTITNPLKYYFHDNSIHSTSIASWSWHFDDGDSSNLQDPIHIFPYAGIYFVSLKITTTGGCSSSITYPVKVSNPQPYNVWGRVYAGPYVIDKCIAYLYKEYNNDYYKPVDTVRLTSINDTLGVYYFFQVPEGKHKVKVLLPDASVYSEDYAPTYYGDKLKWDMGSTINLFQDVSHANVFLEDVIKTQGNCQINIHINSTNTNLITQKDIEILLYNSNGTLADYTFTNAQGEASFNDVGVGSYYVSSDVTGLLSNMASLTLNNNFDTISNLSIALSNTSLVGYFIQEQAEKEYVLYPNPVFSQLMIQFKEPTSEEVMVEIFDIQGKILFNGKEKVSADAPFKLSVEFLDEGFYFVKLTDIQSGRYFVKKFIKK